MQFLRVQRVKKASEMIPEVRLDFVLDVLYIIDKVTLINGKAFHKRQILAK